MFKKPIFWIILALVLLIAVGGTYYYFYYQKEQKPKDTGKVTLKETPKETSKEVKVEHVTDPGVTWMEPVKTDDLDLIKVSENLAQSSSGITQVQGYYKIAELQSGGELILAIATPEGPSLPYQLRFKKDSDGKYFYLANHSSVSDYSESAKFLENAQFDSQTKYQSLSAPAFLTVKNTLMKKARGEGLFSSLKATEELADTEYGVLYKSPVNTELKEVGGITFSVKLADSTYVNYLVAPKFVTDDEVALLTWSSGKENEAKYTAEGYVSCGMVSSNNAILNLDDLENRLLEAGETSTNEKIYTTSTSDEVMKSAYENYKIGRNQDVLTIEAFAEKNPIFVWKSGLDEYIVYTGRDFAGLAECGKPVIYLYPEKKMNVLVKVGATITKSEPDYGDGWKVVASPKGLLNVNGKTYDSLFWEGQGQEYPAITEGTVVKQSEVRQVLEKQMGELGLNEKEKSDFMEFWLPKMPQTPYIRFTWFGTSQMEKLAPLAITPEPETLIRVFLDFEGLENPIDIKPQNLTSIPRKGFTVVEWGGLLK